MYRGDNRHAANQFGRTILTDIFETKIEIIDGPHGPVAIY